MWKYVLLKKARKYIAKKNLNFIFSGTVEKKDKYAHDSIQCLKNVVHYLNMKMQDILVEIIYLKLCSSLNWDGVGRFGLDSGVYHMVIVYKYMVLSLYVFAQINEVQCKQMYCRWYLIWKYIHRIFGLKVHRRFIMYW